MGFPAVVGAAVSIGSSILGAGNPQDQQRLDTVRSLKDAALAGDNDAYIRLKCLAGEKTQQAVALGYVRQNENCGCATEVCKGAAAAAVQEIELRQSAGTGLVTVASSAASAANQVDPNSIQREVLANFTAGISILPLVGIGLLLFLLLRRK